MSQKRRSIISAQQKLEYAKMMVENGYSNKQIEEISGASSSAITRWKRQYNDEKQGIMFNHKKALTPELQKLQELEKKLARANRDIDILKKASALFIRDN